MPHLPKKRKQQQQPQQNKKQKKIHFSWWTKGLSEEGDCVVNVPHHSHPVAWTLLTSQLHLIPISTQSISSRSLHKPYDRNSPFRASHSMFMVVIHTAWLRVSLICKYKSSCRNHTRQLCASPLETCLPVWNLSILQSKFTCLHY